jgi:uncharacterized delta-60 repeat protein
MAGYDLTFDIDGKAITDLGSISDRILQLMPTVNSKILAEGINSSNIVVAQYNPDGSLDTGFGVGGKLDTGLKGFTATGGSGSITTTSTGKIVITGADANGISVVARFLANGQLDTSFGTSGRYSTQNTDAIITTVTSLNIVDGSEGVIFTQENISTGNKYDVFTSLDANGQIVPLALNGNTSAIPLKLDLNILNGILASATINNADPNVQGVLSIIGQPLINSLRSQYTASNFTINGIRAGVLGDGSIIINFFGYQNPVALSGFVSFESHLKLDGTFDLNYGTNGLATLPFPADYKGIADFGIDKADRIVLAIYNAATDDISVYRLNTSGQADATFGTNGKLTLPGVTGVPDSIVVEVDSQNRVLINVKKTADNIFNVTRVNSNGTIDNTFGTSGKLQLPTEANSRLSAPAVILGADNRLFVGGVINGDILVAKYNISENATIYDVAVDKISIIEGNSGNTPVVFTINRSGITSSATSLNYTLGGTAANTTDYNIDTIGGGLSGPYGGLIDFAANETTKILKINVSGDALVEIDETILLNIFDKNPQSSIITKAAATTTIQNDDGLNQTPTITNATYSEFFSSLFVSGNGFLSFAGNNNDIDVSKLSIIGQGSKTYNLTSNNVELGSVDGFRVILNTADKAAITSILNNNGNYSTDGTKYSIAAAEDWAAGADPTLVIADLANNGITTLLGLSGSGYGYGAFVDPATTNEGNSGTKDLTFTVSANGFSTADYATVDGTAIAGIDYEATSGTLNFAPGELSKTITVKIKGDTDLENNESFTLRISSRIDYSVYSGDPIAISLGAGTILDDDQSSLPATVPTITSATFDTFTSTLVVSGTGFLALAGANNDINVSKLSFTGEGGKSYTLTSNNVEITSDTSFSVVLSVADDTEIDKLINKDGTTSNGGTIYNLAAAEGWAAAADPTLKIADLTNNVVTVTTNSSPISIDSVSISEGNSGTKDLIFTVTGFANNLGLGTADVGSVDYTTVDGTATAGSDYVATSGRLNFLPGELSKTITVKVNGDNNFEPNETFTIKLSNSIGNVIANDTGTATIINDDVQVSGNSNTLRFTKISHLAQYRNELGVFTIDDAQGTVNSIAPSQTGYLAEVLKRSQVIFSALGESAVDLQLDNQSSRYLDFPAGQQLGYYLVQDASTNDLNTGAKPPVFFAFPSNDSGLANAKFTQNGTVSQLAFDDTPGGDKDFNDLVVQIENATSPAPLGTAQQGNKSIFDLTSVVNTTSVQTNFEVKRDASYNNHIGFYKIEDAQGSILAGTALIKPGEAGYREAIVQGRIAGIDLVGANGQTVASNGSFQGGALYAPFLIVNSSSNNADFSNIFTAYSLGNADKVDHVRLLGDNTFGFEDLFGGGDRDYNDVIIKATFASTPGDFSQG